MACHVCRKYRSAFARNHPRPPHDSLYCEGGLVTKSGLDTLLSDLHVTFCVASHNATKWMARGMAWLVVGSPYVAVLAFTIGAAEP